MKYQVAHYSPANKNTDQEMNFLKNHKKYPNISRLINSGGQLDIGYIQELNSYIVASDKIEIIWEGKNNYETLEDALDDAEQGIKEAYESNE